LATRDLQFKAEMVSVVMLKAIER